MISIRFHQQKRPGFTLIEMLVIISIVIVLATLTVGAVMKFRQTGPRIATKSSLKNINAKLDDQWKAVADRARNEPITSTSNTVLNNLGFANSADPRYRAKYVDLCLIQAFPMSFDEVLQNNANTTASSTLLPSWPAYVRYLSASAPTGLGLSTGNGTPLNIQQSVCLLMALQKGPKNTGVTADALGSTAVQLLTLTGSTTQAQGCTDAWNTPLLFNRGSGSPLIPLILSAGEDGQYGVNLTTLAVTNAAQAADNITSSSP